jgi:hypothetical protein
MRRGKDFNSNALPQLEYLLKKGLFFSDRKHGVG